MTNITPVVRNKVVNMFNCRYVTCIGFMLIVSALQLCFAEESNDELQLFFSANEQFDGQHRLPLQQPDSPGEALDKQDSAVAKLKRLPVTSVTSSGGVIRNKNRIFLNGVVRTEQSLLPLINDLPCQAINLSNSNELEKIKHLDCDHIDSKDYVLKLRASDYGLLVYRHDKYLATLFVGQSL